MRQLRYVEAIAEAMKEEMARDEGVFVIGEDVHLFGGVWKATKGLMEAYGSKRVCGTPISESAFTGLAVGAAMTGLRPVVEFMYFNFVQVAMDQLVDQMAKVFLMSGGRVSVPITIRAQVGVGSREAAQHSDSLEAWFVHTPGIKVVMPATVYDAKGLLKSAIRDDQPVLYVENRMLYYKKEEVPDGEWLVPIGKARVVKEGRDVTVVTVGYALTKVLGAVASLGASVDVEIVDARTVQPLDLETILASVRKTKHLLVVHEAPTRCGIGAEIVRRVVEVAFGDLAKAPKVLGAASVPVPFSPALEDACIPQEADIAEAIRRLISR
jgi:pyruvate dehydrogenase E1 component beta subunit